MDKITMALILTVCLALGIGATVLCWYIQAYFLSLFV